MASQVFVRWERTATGFRSACGRFRIGVHGSKTGYLGLTDAVTGTEHVCRTEDSAKTTARNIVRYGNRFTG